MSLEASLSSLEISGEKLHECFLQNIDNVEKKVREGIDEEELQTFFKVAKQIRENLEQMQRQSAVHGKRIYN